MSEVSHICSVCGSAVMPNTSFCPNCGAPIAQSFPPQDEPRQSLPVPHPEQLAINCPTLPQGAFRSCVTRWLIGMFL